MEAWKTGKGAENDRCRGIEKPTRSEANLIRVIRVSEVGDIPSAFYRDRFFASLFERRYNPLSGLIPRERFFRCPRSVALRLYAPYEQASRKKLPDGKELPVAS